LEAGTGIGAPEVDEEAVAEVGWRVFPAAAAGAPVSMRVATASMASGRIKAIRRARNALE
jgi:hypothetical protein